MDLQELNLLKLELPIKYKIKEKQAQSHNKGFAIVGRNCKVQRLFFGLTFVLN